MTSFDPNTWYQVTESRVGFNSSLQINDAGLFVAKECGDCNNQLWQLLPIDNNRFQLRNHHDTIKKQLAVCFIATEADASKTHPCMADPSADETQQWNLNPWGDGTFYIENVANGSNYRLDVHPGNPVFMSSAISTDTPQPAQHWMFTSLSAINDGAYSTTIAPSTSTATSAPSSTITTAPTKTGAAHKPTGKGKSGSTSGLSAGAKAGIGIGVALAALLLVGAILFFAMRKRRAERKPLELAAERNGEYRWDRKETQPPPVHEAPGHEAQVYEMDVPPTEVAGNIPGRHELQH